MDPADSNSNWGQMRTVLQDDRLIKYGHHRALENHAQSAKHVKLNNESGAIKMFFSPKYADHNKNDVKRQNDFHVSNGITDAEIRWVLNIVKKHVS